MLLFLINPASSSGNGIKIWKKIKTYLEEENISFRFKILRGPGDATVTAQRLCESKKKCTVVIVGGDGTVNEFLTGVKDGSNISLSVIPTGSGNDFVKGLDLPDDPLECLDVILHGAHAHALTYALHVVEGVATGLNKVFECPTAVTVTQTIVYGLVSDEGILVGWHTGGDFEIVIGRDDLLTLQR